MRVPLLDLQPQLKALEAEIKSAVLGVIDSTRYIMGPRVEELENAVAEYSGARFGIGMSSGTDALLAALMALDVGPGDLVITPTYSFFATAGVVARLHATPVFIDCDATTYNLDPQALARWFEQHPAEAARVKAIMPVHLYGQCADMDAINAIACQHNVPVIEDAAQAIGAAYPSKQGLKRAGSMGLAGCFSFFPSKNLGAIGDGGLVVTNDEQFADKLRKLRNHGETSRYHHQYVGGNFRLDPLQAAVLLVKLPHLEAWHSGRRANAAYYDRHLSIAGLKKPVAVYGREHHIYNQYIISVPRDRDGLKRFLDEQQIGNAIYYPVPFHRQECFAALGYRAGDFPHSEYAAEHTLALPVYPELTDEMKDCVIARIREFYA
jgi:dTDP-4-amino-4,6-dideoxygalactose transaminase